MAFPMKCASTAGNIYKALRGIHMNHLGTKTIETSRLILRRFTLEDVQAMYRNWASDPAVTKYLTWPTHTSEEVTHRVLSDWVGHYEEENYYIQPIIFSFTRLWM